jgi:hypothetical protein
MLYQGVSLRDFSSIMGVIVNEETPCSTQARSEPLLGTAPFARGWILLRADGAWGAQAVSATVSENLREWAAAQSYKVLLVRQHDTHDPLPGHQFWISTHTGEFTTGRVSSYSDIPLVTDNQPAAPMFIVCTNGARDQCCAVLGIALRKQLEHELSIAERHLVWEGTHIGGHRFAPTCLYLPGNLVLGRVSVTDALMVIRHGEIPRAQIRGRSHLSPCHQVLEMTVPDYSSFTWSGMDSPCPDYRHSHEGNRGGIVMSFDIEPYVGPERSESCGEPGKVCRSLRHTTYMS